MGNAIPLAPKWESIVPILLRIYADPSIDTKEKDNIEEQFLSIARFVDQCNDEKGVL
jgi:hypothetical protein